MIGAVFLAAQWWWPKTYEPTARAAAPPSQSTAAECVFVNHVRRGRGHRYRQDAGETCRYEIEPRVTY